MLEDFIVWGREVREVILFVGGERVADKRVEGWKNGDCICRRSGMGRCRIERQECYRGKSGSISGGGCEEATHIYGDDIGFDRQHSGLLYTLSAPVTLP